MPGKQARGLCPVCAEPIPPDETECWNCGAFVIDEAVVRLSRAFGLDREKALKLFEAGFRHTKQPKDRDPNRVLETGEVGHLFVRTNSGSFVPSGDMKRPRGGAAHRKATGGPTPRPDAKASGANAERAGATASKICTRSDSRRTETRANAGADASSHSNENPASIAPTADASGSGTPKTRGPKGDRTSLRSWSDCGPGRPEDPQTHPTIEPDGQREGSPSGSGDEADLRGDRRESGRCGRGESPPGGGPRSAARQRGHRRLPGWPDRFRHGRVRPGSRPLDRLARWGAARSRRPPGSRGMARGPSRVRAGGR